MDWPSEAWDSVQEPLAEFDWLLGLQAETLHETGLSWLLQRLQRRVEIVGFLRRLDSVNQS